MTPIALALLVAVLAPLAIWCFVTNWRRTSSQLDHIDGVASRSLSASGVLASGRFTLVDPVGSDARRVSSV